MHGFFGFQNQNNGKFTHSFAPRPLIFMLQQEVLKFNDICVKLKIEAFSNSLFLKSNLQVNIWH